MSIRREISITCPECKKEHPFIMWESINTAIDPEMRSTVKDRSAFLFTCPTCGTKNYINYGFLYHQMEDQIMIHYANTDENEKEIYKALYEDNTDNMMEEFRKADYLIRIVRSQNELREKIFIFDEGLDDRIIEVYKLLVFVSIHDDHPEWTDVKILFSADNENKSFTIFVDGKPIGSVNFSDELYNSLCEKHLAALPDMRSDIPFIGISRAMEIMGMKK